MSAPLPAGTRRVLAALARVICPPEAQELGIIPAIVDHVGLTLSVSPPLLRRGFVLGVATYDVGALVWLPGRGRRAHLLPPELAERYFLTWLHGPTPLHRQLAIAIKQLLSLAHYEQPEVQARMGYRPAQWIEQVKRRRLDVYGEAIARHQASLIAPDPLVPGARRRKKEVA